MLAGEDEGSQHEEPHVVAGLSLVRPGLRSVEAVLRAVAALALEQGYVLPTFADALVQREISHPTGLPTPVPVAIPHTDVEHVLRPALAGVLLDPCLRFGEMGGAGEMVDARLVVVLMVTDPTGQVGLLARLIAALRRPDLDAVLSTVDHPVALATALNSLLSSPTR